MNMTKVNDRISAVRVLLIMPDGEKRGEVARSEALTIARQSGMDLVEVSTGVIPVCKIMDYGKLKYQQKKHEKNQNHAHQPKEVRIGFNTGEHDLIRQVNKAKEFLETGHTVFFVMKVKGRAKSIAQCPAKERFFTLAKSLNETVKLSDIQESDKGYSIVLKPNK